MISYYFKKTYVTQFFMENDKIIYSGYSSPIVSRIDFPYIIKKDVDSLVCEYLDAQNKKNDSRTKSLEVLDIDFEQDCIVILIVNENGVNKSLHCNRAQIEDDY